MNCPRFSGPQPSYHALLPLQRNFTFRVRRAGRRQDWSENNSSDAPISSEPTKNVWLMAKCSSAIHRDRMSDTSAVNAGTKFQNIATKPLPPPVTVREI